MPEIRLSWTRVPHGGAIGRRSRHCLVYDGNHGRAVLFGGSQQFGGTQTLNDVWTFDGATWKQLPTRGFSPADRDRAKMVFDEHRGFSVLFGGQRPLLGNWYCLSDTWRLDNDKWSKVWTWLRRTPPRRCGHMMAYDRAGRQTVMFGGAASVFASRGDTWVFDGAAWRRLSVKGPLARRYAEFAWDEHLGGCVLYGGCADDFGRVPFTDCWLFRENRWEYMPWASNLGQRDDGAMLFHPTLRRLMLFSTDESRGETAVLTRAGWQSVSELNPPPTRQCFGAAYLPAMDAILTCGGEVNEEHRFGDTFLVRCSETS